MEMEEREKERERQMQLEREKLKFDTEYKNERIRNAKQDGKTATF